MTDLDAVFELSERLSGCEPDGFIFHTSRCGSTLVCNALKTAAPASVVSEAQPIGSILAPFAPASIWPFPAETWMTERNHLVRAMIRVFGQLRASPSARYFVKFNSWNTLALHIVREVWPDVKWIFLYRDPIETLVSNLRKSPSWLEQRNFPNRAAAFFGFTPEQLSAMSVEEFGARVVALYYSKAAAMADHRGLLVNYIRLNGGGLRQILDFLEVGNDELKDDRIDRLLRVYSKDKDGLRPFLGDSEEKQAAASVTLRQAVDRWAREAFERLNEKTVDEGTMD